MCSVQGMMEIKVDFHHVYLQIEINKKKWLVFNFEILTQNFKAIMEIFSLISKVY